MGNNPKIFFSLAIYPWGRVRNEVTFCIIRILSGTISQMSDANKNILYLNNFKIRPIAAYNSLIAHLAQAIILHMSGAL